jgi:hypothetical protein
MASLGRVLPSILTSLCLLAVSTTAPAQIPSGTPVSPDAAALQKKASEAEVRIRGNEGDSDQLKRAVKINEVALAKEILLRNGFTAKDLEDARISLRTGGGKGGEDKITISVTCCVPKEITIQRTLENFTK